MATIGINSVDHAARLLKCLALSEQAMAVTDLSRELALPRPTIYRLLTTLTEHRLVHQDGKTYRLGLQALELGEAARAQILPGNHAKRILEELVRDTGETAHFGILEDDRVAYVVKVESPHPIRMFSRVGWRGPLHASGIGKVLLAWGGEPLIERVLAKPLERFTEKTITDALTLSNHIKTVIRQGYGEDNEELIDGLTCVAAPVMVANRLVGAISVAGPTARLKPMPALRVTVMEASKRLAATLSG